MSYTLKGRFESRLASAVPALIVALALQRWWAIELVALMIGLGLVLDAGVYHRALAYQPGWLAVPLGALELGLVYGGIHVLGIMAPLGWAFALYAIGWLTAQIAGHAVFPGLRIEYAEEGGELGRFGAVTAVAVCATLVCGLGAARAVRPPTIHLHGTVQGPLVIRHAQTLVGGIVMGGILIRANHVTLRDVTVIGGENGIDVAHATHVMLEDVRVVRASMDAIHVRDSGVMIDGCSIADPGGPWVQGVDISYSMGRPMSTVSGCTIAGVREGIVTHSAAVDVSRNRVLGATLRGIVLGEMSMDTATHNEIVGANGVGILCLDHSTCTIEHNTIAGTRVAAGGDLSRAGVAIEAHYFAQAQIAHNTVVASPGGIKAFDQSTITR